MKSGLLLDIVIRKSTAIFQLLACEDKTLLIRWDAFLILDLSFDVLDSVRDLDLESNSLSSESLNENLHFDKSREGREMKSNCKTEILREKLLKTG